MAGVPREEYAWRVERARQLMERHAVDALVVTDPTSYSYFAGHKPSGGLRSRPFLFVLPRQGEPAIRCWAGPDVLARCYHQPFPSWVEDRKFYPDLPFSTDSTVDWGLREVLEDRGLRQSAIALELGRETWLGIAVNDFLRLREELPRARFVDSGRIIWGCRMIKSAWEIACARKACELGGRAWQRALSELRIGDSALEFKKKIYRYYAEEGLDLDFCPLTVLGATGANGTFQKGDVLYLDTGPSYLGYKMDFTRRAVFGPPSARQRYEHATMWEILGRVMRQLKPGVPASEVFAFSQQELSRLDFRNYSDHPAKRIGHGIGLETEPPYFNAFDHTPLQAGMIVTPEPKIETADGLLNAEEQVVITSDGYELLSTHPTPELLVIE
ncbi:MAG: aminopeptidase P family protein [Candidatus Tectomicrobia bacterium]|nr:aminopeptidase P family protein [Candidatus Tectomicrobia bacterium]